MQLFSHRTAPVSSLSCDWEKRGGGWIGRVERRGLKEEGVLVTILGNPPPGCVERALGWAAPVAEVRFRSVGEGGGGCVGWRECCGWVL